MSNCDVIRELLVLHGEGALASADARRVEEHLATCGNCRKELAQVGKIREWLSDPEIFGPDEDLVWQMLPQKLAQRALQLQPDTPTTRFRIPVWAWSAVALAILTLGVVWIMRVQTSAPPANLLARAGAENQEFVQRILTAYTREATIQYLGGCHDLLLDLASATKKCDRSHFDVSLEVAQARRLLQQKRLLDAAPDVPELDHTRSLCDDLERFLVGVSNAQDCESDNALQIMERSMAREKLLLRINVVSSGIS